MNYEFKTNIEKSEFEQFTQNAEILSFMQEYGWASVKSEWKHFYCGLYCDGKLVATAVVLKRLLPLGLSFMYIPRGMLIDYQDKELLKIFTKHLQQLAKQEHAYVLKIDPNFCCKEYSIKEIEKKETVEIPKNYSVDYEKKTSQLIILWISF